MNSNTYLCYDLETTGPNPYYDIPIEIAAIALKPRTLESYKDNLGQDITFYSLVQIPEEFLKAAEADPKKKASLEGALKINNKTLDDLAEAPDLKTVWRNFVNFCQQYSSKPSDSWRSVIPVTYNGNGFDNVMIDRLAKEFGDVDGEGRSIVFHKNLSVDLYQDMFRWTENSTKPGRLNLDTIRKWTKYPEGAAHTAMYDAYTVKHLFCRLQKKQREISQKVVLENCFEISPLGPNE